MINEKEIRKHLTANIPITVFESVDSTNNAVRRYLNEHENSHIVFIANEQTSGRGRMGRRFYSPPDTGIYMTYAFQAAGISMDVLRITTVASVAVLRALNCGARIKWVNDLYLYGRKICGILTEMFTSLRSGQIYLLVGIGINLTTIDFPEDICGIAGSIGGYINKEETIASICNHMFQMVEEFPSPAYLADYRRHLLGVNQEITYTEQGQSHTAVIEGVDDFGRLIVKEAGQRKALCSVDISMHGQQSH